MKEELISVIVPVYNVEKYLNNCIDSILKQTYKKIEIVIVDDGSTDTSSRICDDYLKEDSRVKVIHKKNGGLSDARNVGIRNSSGEYVTFVDSDDDIVETYIEYLYLLVKKYNTKVSIASYTVVSSNNSTNIGKGYEEVLLNTEQCLERMLCEEGFSVSSCAKLYKKELFDNVNFPVSKLNEDNGTTYKLIMQCENIAYGEKSIYNYYKRKNSIMTSSFDLRKMDLIELTDNMCNDIYKKYPKLKDSINKKKIISRFSVLRQMLTGKMDKQQKEIAKELKKYIKDRRNEIFKNPKINQREKVAFLSLLIGDKFFVFSWKIYCRIKY